MVEVIYVFKENKYPFGKGKQSQNTFMQYLLKTKNQKQVDKYRQLNSIFKKINSNTILRLFRVLKEEQTFHMLYEYQTKSLEQRLKELQKQQQLANLFIDLENVFETLIQQKIKAEIYLEYMAVDQDNRLKVFIKPDDAEHIKDSQSKTKKYLYEYYQTQRTRIHLEIEEIFQAHSVLSLKQKGLTKQLQKQKNSTKNAQSTKTNTPNFVIEGNTLVFINGNQKNKSNTSKDSQESKMKSKTTASNFNNMGIQQKPISKIQSKKQSNGAASIQKQRKQVDISKMSIAEKVLYYKKLKQNPNHNQSHENVIIVKDSSTSNASINDLSKSSNNDSNLQIKTEMIGKHKMKITTSEEVQVQGNSDDDLQKLARQKIAKIQKERHERSHNPRENDSLETQQKTSKTAQSGNNQKLLRQLQQNVPQTKTSEKNQNPPKQMTSKIVQAKQKAKNILQKYGQKLKK